MEMLLSWNLKWAIIKNTRYKGFKTARSIHRSQKLAIYQDSTIWFFEKLILIKKIPKNQP